MFGSETLDLVVSLGFVFLLLSLVVTSINEGIAQVFALRAANLEDAIRNLLDPEQQDAELADRFYQHPLIRSLYRTGWMDGLFRRRGRPSYIPNRAFAIAVLDLLGPTAAAGSATTAVARPTGPIGAVAALRDHVDSTIEDAALRAEALRTEVEQWFDDSMQRASGWYKRRMQYFIVLTALVLVLALNADTIAIGNRFLVDEELRTAAAAAADGFVESQDPGNLEVTLEQVHEQLDALALPFGWSNTAEPLPDHEHWLAHFGDSFWYLKAAGLLLTVFAISLGAPFWFDLLSRLVRLRSSGAVPAAAPPTAGAPAGTTVTVTTPPAPTS